MHPQCYEFVKKSITGIDFTGKRVLEIGSKNVNGSVKKLFVGANYFGIDLLPGKDVDLVIGAQDYDGDGLFDYVVSTESLEHCPFPEEIVDCAYRALGSGGYFIVTAASIGRDPHRADGEVGDPRENGEFYKNISDEYLRGMMIDSGFIDARVSQVGTDVQGTAVRL